MLKYRLYKILFKKKPNISELRKIAPYVDSMKNLIVDHGVSRAHAAAGAGSRAALDRAQGLVVDGLSFGSHARQDNGKHNPAYKSNRDIKVFMKWFKIVTAKRKRKTKS